MYIYTYSRAEEEGRKGGRLCICLFLKFESRLLHSKAGLRLIDRTEGKKGGGGKKRTTGRNIHFKKRITTIVTRYA